MASKSTEIEVAKPEEYGIVAQPTGDLMEIMEANIGGTLSQFDLDRISVPAGGGRQWIIPTLEGEEDSPVIDGIIVHWKEPRAYWETSFDESGGGTPPDCNSQDGMLGQGKFGPGSDTNPSGRCDTCPMSQWGSDPKGGSGQACKQMRVLFMVGKEDLLPMAVVAPPTSINPIKKFMLRLASRSIPYWGVVTRLELEQDSNKDGIRYSKIKPSVATRLSPEQAEQVHAYGQAIQRNLDSVLMDVVGDAQEDVSTG